jgi:hypothetical protein
MSYIIQTPVAACAHEYRDGNWASIYLDILTYSETSIYGLFRKWTQNWGNSAVTLLTVDNCLNIQCGKMLNQEILNGGSTLSMNKTADTQHSSKWINLKSSIHSYYNNKYHISPEARHRPHQPWSSCIVVYFTHTPILTSRPPQGFSSALPQPKAFVHSSHQVTLTYSHSRLRPHSLLRLV